MATVDHGKGRPRPGLRLLAVGYVVVLALILLWPRSVSDPFAPLLNHLEEAAPGSVVLLELGANVVLFLPVGVLLTLMLPRRARLLALPIGMVLSVAVEFVQGAALPERVAALSDIIMNSIGVALGVCATVVVLRCRRGPAL